MSHPLGIPQISAYKQLTGPYYRAMHFSAMRGIGIACRLSVTLVVFEFVHGQLARQLRSSDPARHPREHGEILGRLEEGCEKMAH